MCACSNLDMLIWEDYIDEFIRISKIFKNYFFELNREGENYLDIEKIYFNNSNVQRCPVIIDFEPCKLNLYKEQI